MRHCRLLVLVKGTLSNCAPETQEEIGKQPVVIATASTTTLSTTTVEPSGLALFTSVPALSISTHAVPFTVNGNTPSV